MNKYMLALAIGVLSIVSSVHGASIWVDKAAPKSITKRDITVDGRGFYLGGGSNNNLREASQLFDLGGPIANPWINPWTQPMPRTGIWPAPVAAPIPPAVAHPPPAAPAAPAQGGYGGYGQAAPAAPAYGQAAPAYGQAAPAPAPAYGQQAAPAPAAPAYGQAAPAPYAQAAPAPAAPAYGQQAAPAPAPAQTNYQGTYLPLYPGDHSQLNQQAAAPGYGQQAAPAPAPAPYAQAAPAPYAQAAPAPAPAYGQQAAPAPYAQAAPAPYAQAAPAPAPAYGQQAAPAPYGQAAPAPAYGGGYGADQGGLHQSDNNKPFTAVFVPGQPTLFKLGTPQDIQSGSYTSI